MTKVYIVTNGEYSSYHIIAAFTSLEEAEKLANELNLNDPYDNARVLDMELDKHVPSTLIYYVSYDEGDDRWSCKLVEPDEDPRYTEYPPHINKVKSERDDQGNGYYWVFVNNPDREAALKIGTEQIMQFKARGGK